MSDTKEVKIKLKKIYPAVCMLSGVTYNLTAHHTTVKREHGGTLDLENMSLINERVHCGYLHSVIERKCKLCYDEINKMIMDYKLAFDTGNQAYIDWHRQMVFPVFKDILNTQYECKQRRRKK